MARCLDRMEKERIVDQQKVSLERTLSELDWNGTEIPTVFANALWAWVQMGQSCKPMLRQLCECTASADLPEACRELLAIMLDVARRTGKLELLRRPRVRELDEVLNRLDELIAED